jgi:hypothetical protein
MIRFRLVHVNPKWERGQIEGIKRGMKIKEFFKTSSFQHIDK